MTRPIKIALCLFVILGFSATLRADAAQGVSVVWTLKQEGSVGQGAALSPDATKIAYVGTRGELHVVELASQTDRMLKLGVGTPDITNDPSFSPDGKRIVFSASGGNWHSPSDIYSVGLDGTGLLQLTHSKPAPNADELGVQFAGEFVEYFYKPRYSPDGSQILVWRHPGTTRTDPNDQAIALSTDGSGRHTLTEGTPLGWAASGKAIFAVKGDKPDEVVLKYDLTSGKTQVVKGIENAPMGKLRADDTFAVDNYGGWDW
ncbi:MAG: hypothetical protein ABSD31_03950 [Candidatus Binataceae bacterium]